VRSLRAQDHAGWRLLARDDGSTDGTPALLARLAREEPRLTVLGAPGRLGVVGNFGALLEAARDAGASYVLPCDQDDVWRPDKLSRMLEAMAALEARHGAGAPLLVHSDLEVVDQELRTLHPSFLRHQGIRHEDRDPLQVLLVQNFVTGCASLLNAPLLDLALPLPAACLMHDWWIAQCAAAAGAVGFVPEALVRYRQHAANEVGAGGAFGNLKILSAAGRRRFARAWRVGHQSVDQAGALAARLRERGGAGPGVLELVDGVARLGEAGPLSRLLAMRRLGVRRLRPVDTALLFARMALLAVAAGPGPGAQR
jgi:rhamnosyltransferase